MTEPWGDLRADAAGILDDIAPTHRIDPVAVTAGPQHSRLALVGLRWLFGTRAGVACFVGWMLLSIHIGLTLQGLLPQFSHPIPVLGHWLVNLVIIGGAPLLWNVTPWLILRDNDIEKRGKVEVTVQLFNRAFVPVTALATFHGLLLVTGPGTNVGQFAMFLSAPTTSVLGIVGLVKVGLVLNLHLVVLNRAIENMSIR